mgnify:CR=1 FL=1
MLVVHIIITFIAIIIFYDIKLIHHVFCSLWKQPFLSRGGFSDGGWRREMLQEVVGSAAIRSVGIETGTKLYLSNLEYGVSNEDIKVIPFTHSLCVFYLSFA